MCRSFLRLSGPSLAFLLCLNSPLLAQEPVRIGKIEIKSLDVYSPEETARGWPYRAMASIHATTRESTIRKFLLFREGEVLSPEALAESERNLRAQPFIRSARVEALPPRDGVADVEVVTQDTWTLEPSVLLARRGGVTTFGVSLTERNLLGTGRELEGRYDQEVNRISRSLAYIDPHFLRRYWRGFLILQNNSDGGEEHVGIEKAFAATITPWAGTIRWDAVRQTRRLYEGGAVVSRFQENRQEGLIEYGRALDRTGPTVSRLSLGLETLRDNFDSLASYPTDLRPDDREFRYLFLQGEIARTRLMKLNFVDEGSRYQDFDLGPRASLLAGLSPRAFGVDQTTEFVEAQLSGGIRGGRSTFATATLDLQSRLDAVNDNTVLSGELRFVHRFGTRFPQALVARAAVQRGWDLDPDLQFFADGATGLRAFPLYAYEGDRTALWNVEHRISLTKEFMQFVVPGMAFFVDGGTAVPPGQPLETSQWKSDAGFGFRLAFPRASVHTIVRLDFGFPFQADPEGRRGLLISFSSSQAF
jgi:hypothetical protein